MLHQAYSFSLAFEASVVSSLLDRFAGDKSTVLDPFCGTGTTLLESKMHGFPSFGVDANPVCVMVSRAKTEWNLNVDDLRSHADLAVLSASHEYELFLRRRQKYRARGCRHYPLQDPIFERSSAGRYLVSSGLIRRGWISPLPALKTLLLAEALWNQPERIRNFLFLSLFGLLVPEISNMSYGPEIYRARRRKDRDVFGLFQARTSDNLSKLNLLRSEFEDANATIVHGNSTSEGLDHVSPESVDLVISSPPYLSDHDYSRLTRLELVFSGHVSSREHLRDVKRQLLRSSSKNVYRGDDFAGFVKRFQEIQDIIKLLKQRADEHSTSGFARVYPRLVGEYFGGMYVHFKKLSKVLRPSATVAYIVGDQSSFFAIPIPTARITAQMAESCGAGLRVLSMEPVKKYRGTRGRVKWSNQEWLLLMKKDG